MKTAVLLLNGGTAAASMTLDFSTVPGFKGKGTW
jgi:hypothetical protein